MKNQRSAKLAYSQAQRHLARSDAVLKRLMAQVGACTLQPDPDGFAVLVRSIISQQISTRAAAAIRSRLQQTLAPHGLQPEAVAQARASTLRQAGLSEAKTRALHDLAAKTLNGTLQLDLLRNWPDEEVIAHLLPVRGIGRWTAEMFLIFSLGRLDVLPLADFGLRAGVRNQYQMQELPTREELLHLAEEWRPYRTVATWFIWRSFGAVPQSDNAAEKKK